MIQCLVMWCMLALLAGPWSGPVWALAANSVTVDGSAAARKGEYFQQPVNVANTGGALWRSVAVTSGGSSSNCAFAFPKYQTTPTYDLDGNLTFDGVWNYQWDAENRLRSMNMTNITGVPNAERKRLDFLYDDAGRRVMKAVSVWNGSVFANPVTKWFVYDGWNLAGELSVTAEGWVELVRSYTWGLDLSGSLDGAGGIGGLVVVTDYATGTSYFPAYDGNGNILALVNAVDGSLGAQYEYSPFGELIRSTGTMAKANPFRWSTKYWDEETGLVCYPSRYYSPTIGRWLNQDTIGEDGGNNLYAFVGNSPLNLFDPFGMTGTVVDTQAGTSGAETIESGGGSQATTFLRNIRQWADEFNEFQQIASDVMDVLDGGDDLLIAVLEASNQNAAKGRGGESASARLGRTAHKLYNPGEDYRLNKAIPGSSGKFRPDAVDFVKGIVRELKPFTKNGIRQGRVQMKKYINYLNENFKRDGGWKGFVDYY